MEKILKYSPFVVIAVILWLVFRHFFPNEEEPENIIDDGISLGLSTQDATKLVQLHELIEALKDPREFSWSELLFMPITTINYALSGGSPAQKLVEVANIIGEVQNKALFGQAYKRKYKISVPVQLASKLSASTYNLLAKNIPDFGLLMV